MAYSLSVSAKIPEGNKFHIEPKWWDKDELRKAYKFQEVWEHGCYMDYVLNADKRTLIEIVNNQEQYRHQGVFT